MADTKNCSSAKSREHYVSESILKQLPELYVGGVPWQKPGEFKQYPTSALTAGVLCQRHNSALAPLDRFAAHAFNAFCSAAKYAAESRHPGRAQHYLIGGQGLELWMVKLLAGAFSGGVAAREGKPIRENFVLPREKVANLLSGNEQLTFPAGLHVTSQADTPFRWDHVTFVPIMNRENRQTSGVEVQFGPLLLQTYIAGANVTDVQRRVLSMRYRPNVIDFSGPARDARVMISWRKFVDVGNSLVMKVESSS